MRPSVLVLTSTLPRFTDDPEPGFVLHLSKELTKYFDVTVLAPMGEGAELEEKLGDLRICRYRYAPFRAWETLAYPGGIMPRLRNEPWRWVQVPMLMLGLWFAIRRLQKKTPFDLLHAHWLIPQGLVALLARRRGSRSTLVCTSHGGDIHSLMDSPAKPLLSWVLGQADCLTTVSPLLLEEAETLVRGGLRHGATIPMGVDVQAFGNWAGTTGSTAPNTDVPRLLFVGRLAEKKGLRFLLDALAQPVLAGKKLVLSIAGDGPLRPELEAQTRALGLEYRVEFLGAVPYREVSELMSHSDIFVAPSVIASDGDCDGLPTVILESVAKGLAVITTPVGGIQQIIQDGITGRLVSPEDPVDLARAIEELLSSQELRSRLAAAALEKIALFDWQVIAARYADLFQQLLSKKPVVS